jgi:hypothetical protein
MSDPLETAAAAAPGPIEQPQAPPKKTKREPWTVTDDGCRTEIRVGGLLMFVGLFGWQWLIGPKWGTWLMASGALAILVGVPVQALEARRGRPGYPWKLGIILTAFAGALLVDLTYREQVGGPLLAHPAGWFFLGAAVWTLGWWPVARRRQVTP